LEAEESSKKKHWRSMAFPVLLTLVGLGTIGYATYKFGQVLRAHNWRPVKATVLSVNLVSSADSETISHRVEMEYEYSLGAKSFKGNAVSFNDGMTNMERYEALYHKLNRSRIIQVYVNESDPSESVAVRGVTNLMICIVIFSLMWNSLVMNFVLPFFFQQLKTKRLLIITMVIWVLGFCKLIFPIMDIDISKQVVVIEARENTE
jgi:hypothetical protein